MDQSKARLQPTRIIVVGGGWTGLAAARAYLQIQPNVELTIIDEDSTVGGVWSGSRSYPGLIADSCVGIFEYSDCPMGIELGLENWADLPAAKVHEYLEHYVEKFQLRQRCRLNTKVIHAERDEMRREAGAIWKVQVETRQLGEQGSIKETLLCDKLIVATGTSSTPRLPDDVDWRTFEGLVMHSKDIGKRYQDLTANNIQRVTVVGGNKSAVDAVNLCALAGKEVDWVIRKEGNGPGVLFESRTSSGRHAGALKAMRCSAIPSPNILVTQGFWYWFLHSGKNWLGSNLLRWGLSYLSKLAIKSMYGTNENTMKIAPDLKNIFWSQSGVSVVHDGKFMKMVQEGKLIHVHRVSVSSLSGRSVSLSDEQVIPCDAVVFATGWKRNQPSLFDPVLLPELGFPMKIAQEPHDSIKHWSDLDNTSKDRVSTIFPMLASPPLEFVTHRRKYGRPNSTTPFRLFRHIVPPQLAAKGSRDLIVLGIMMNTNIPTYAEVSALWGVAYLEKMPFATATSDMMSDLSSMEENISMVNAWGNFKSPDMADGYPEGSEEIQDFTDLLMMDLRLRPDRKRFAAERNRNAVIFGLRRWCREWFSPYLGSDYKGIVAEYMANLKTDGLVVV